MDNRSILTPEVTLYTKKEVAKLYKCSLQTINNMMKIGKLRYHKMGALVRFRSDELPILNTNVVRVQIEGGVANCDRTSINL